MLAWWTVPRDMHAPLTQENMDAFSPEFHVFDDFDQAAPIDL